jgi:hypothetical protein
MTSRIAFPYTFPFDFYTIPQSEGGVGVDSTLLHLAAILQKVWPGLGDRKVKLGIM